MKLPWALLTAALIVTACAADDATPPLEVAERWMAAYEAGDVTGFSDLMASDAVHLCVRCGYDRAEDPYFGAGGAIAADSRDSRILALGDGALHARCTANGNTVTCETKRISAFGFVDGAGRPVQQDESTYEFTIEDGLVTKYLLTRSSGNLFDFSRLQAYEAWLSEVHPDAHADLFAFGTILVSTETQFAQHQTFVAEYLNSLSDS